MCYNLLNFNFARGFTTDSFGPYVEEKETFGFAMTLSSLHIPKSILYCCNSQVPYFTRKMSKFGINYQNLVPISFNMWAERLFNPSCRRRFYRFLLTPLVRRGSSDPKKVHRYIQLILDQDRLNSPDSQDCISSTVS